MMWNGGWMWFGGIFGFLLLVGFIILIVWLVTRPWGGQGETEGKKSGAVDIARERYAKGEISEEEFQRIKKNLSS